MESGLHWLFGDEWSCWSIATQLAPSIVLGLILGYLLRWQFDRQERWEERMAWAFDNCWRE